MALRCVKSRSFSVTCSLRLPIFLLPRTYGKYWTNLGNSHHVGLSTITLTKPPGSAVHVADDNTPYPLWWTLSEESGVLPAICLCQPPPACFPQLLRHAYIWIGDMDCALFLEGSSAVRQNSAAGGGRGGISLHSSHMTMWLLLPPGVASAVVTQWDQRWSDTCAHFSICLSLTAALCLYFSTGKHEIEQVGELHNLLPRDILLFSLCYPEWNWFG